MTVMPLYGNFRTGQIRGIMYLIDTDTLIFARRGVGGIQERISRVGITNCVISEISLAELYVGAYKKPDQMVFAAIQALENTFTSIPVTSALKTFGKIRAQLETIGYGLDKMDIFIAATAIANDYTLVTHNTKHFSRIPGLKLEDWL